MYANRHDKLTKKYGFRKDQKGIFNRYLREGNNWLSHLTNSKNYILESITDETKSIAVLGSGWLLDFPIDELVSKGIKIDLFDLYHPPQIQKIIKNYDNVSCINLDLTDGFFELFMGKRKNKEAFNEEDMQKYLGHKFINLSNYSLVISLNLLSQLAALIIEKLPLIYSDQVKESDIIKTIQLKHISYLPKGRSILISDFIELNMDDNNTVITEKDLVPILKDIPGNHKREWEWIFDTKKYYHSDYKTYMKVIAMHL
jgi:hypothetical protein